MSEPSPHFDPLRWLPYRRRRGPSEYDKYATFNRRMLAATLDSIILIFFSPILDQIAPIDRSGLASITFSPNDPMPASHLLLAILSDKAFVTSWINNFLIQMTAYLFYSAVCWHFWSATPGKMILRLRIADAETLKPISDLQILLRIIGYLISGLCFMLGFMWIGLNKKKRAWHDYLADTVVIADNWNLIRQPAAPPAAEPKQETPAP